MSTRRNKRPKNRFESDKNRVSQALQDVIEVGGSYYRPMLLEEETSLPSLDSPLEEHHGDLPSVDEGVQLDLTNFPTLAVEAAEDVSFDAASDRLSAHGDLGALFAGIDEPPTPPQITYGNDDTGSVPDSLPAHGDIGAMFADPDHPLPDISAEPEVVGSVNNPNHAPSRPPTGLRTELTDVHSELGGYGIIIGGQADYLPMMESYNDFGNQGFEEGGPQTSRSSRAGQKRKASESVDINESGKNDNGTPEIDPASGRVIHTAATPKNLLNARCPYPNAGAALSALGAFSWHGKHHMFTDREITEMATRFYDASIDCSKFVDKVKDADVQAQTGKCGVKILDGDIPSDDLWQASYNLADSVRRLHNQREGTSMRRRFDPTSGRGRHHERNWDAWHRVTLICEALIMCKKLVEDAVDQPGNVEHLVVLAPEYALKSRLGNMKLNDHKAKNAKQANQNAGSDTPAPNQNSAASNVASPVEINRPSKRTKNTNAKGSKPSAKKSKVSTGSKLRRKSSKPATDDVQGTQSDPALALKLEEPPEDEDTGNFWPSYPPLDRLEPRTGYIETPYYTPTNVLGFGQGVSGTWHPAGEEIESPPIRNDMYSVPLPPPSAFATTQPITAPYPRLYNSSELYPANTPAMAYTPSTMFDSLNSNSTWLRDEATGQMRVIGGFPGAPGNEVEGFEHAEAGIQPEQINEHLEENEADDQLSEDDFPEKHASKNS